jgi:TPR repeat protein
MNLDKLNALALEGNKDAIYEWGTKYFTGDGVPIDSTEGEKWLRKAIELGDDRAMNDLAGRLLHGARVKRDQNEAYQLYEQAIALQNPKAMASYGVIQIELHKNWDEGEQLLKAAIDLGNTYALTELGWRLVEYKNDLIEGEKLLRKAVDVGESYGLFYLGQFIMNQLLPGTEMEAKDLLVQAHQQGNKDALRVLGVSFLQNGNLTEGIHWLREASKAGDSDSMYLLSDCLLNQVGTKESILEAIEHLSTAAYNGHIASIQVLGRTLLYGYYAMNIDLEQGEYWLRKVADTGHPKSMYFLALAIHEGLVPERTENETITLLQKASPYDSEAAMALDQLFKN